MELRTRARAVARPLTHRLGRVLPTSARRRTATALVAVAALGIGGAVTANAVTPPPAHLGGTAGLAKVGPIDDANGFPLWYEDTQGTKLELCIDPDDPYCIIVGERPFPDQPVSFPDNFPDEAFWASAEATIDAGGGETGILVTAVEAAFQNELPAVNEQVSFGRVRIRVAGVIDGETYHVTHPFGTDTIVAEAGAVKGLNVTEDIGSLTWDGVFDQTLGARTGPFLKWDTGAPAGYMGDPSVEHAVTGSPYNTNFFRVEGPAGSFTGSTMLCADPGLGDDPDATDDCIQNDLFAVQGKEATRMGVQVTNVTYRDAPSGQVYLDVFAKSEVGEELVVSGPGVSQTKLRGDGKGGFFARVLATEGLPGNRELVVTNISDSPRTQDFVESGLYGDKVHVTSAMWDGAEETLTVVADSGLADPGNTLSLNGFPNPVISRSGSQWTFVVAGVKAPPFDVTVTSSTGGSDSDDVVIVGTQFAAREVTAMIAATPTGPVAAGQTVNLDGSASVGAISTYAWSITGPGPSQTTSGPLATFTPTVSGSWTARLEVSGAGGTSVAEYEIVVPAGNPDPVANAGVDQLDVVPTSVVTLDGSASQFATAFQWDGPIALTGANTANPTFVVPVTQADQTWTFTLTVTGQPGVTDTAEVVVQSNVDDLTVDAASYKTGGQEWRVRGTAEYCSANNTVRVYWNNGSDEVLLGSTTPAGDLGVCTWDFRLKGAPTGARPPAAGTVTVRSTLGGAAVSAFTRR